jgi:hypothetical protein
MVYQINLSGKQDRAAREITGMFVFLQGYTLTRIGVSFEVVLS